MTTTQLPPPPPSSILPPTKLLRIASLLPSTTDICISLRLDRNVVGITHECDFVPTHPLYYSSDPLLATTVDDDQSDSINNECTSLRGRPATLTISHIDSHILTQIEIDSAVKSSLHDGISLYTLHESALEDVKPTIILTQSLCNVCAVATSEVENRVAAAACSNSNNNFGNECKIISLESETLIDVVNTFITIANVCGEGTWD